MQNTGEFSFKYRISRWLSRILPRDTDSLVPEWDSSASATKNASEKPYKIETYGESCPETRIPPSC